MGVKRRMEMRVEMKVEVVAVMVKTMVKLRRRRRRRRVVERVAAVTNRHLLESGQQDLKLATRDIQRVRQPPQPRLCRAIG